MNQLRPKLVLAEAGAALDWYAEVLNATITARYRHGASVVFASLEVFGTTVTAKDADGADPVPQPGPVLDVMTDEPDLIADRMTAAGAQIIYPIADQPYGARGGRVRDPHGVQWLLQTPVTLTPEEVQAALDRMNGD